MGCCGQVSSPADDGGQPVAPDEVLTSRQVAPLASTPWQGVGRAMAAPDCPVNMDDHNCSSATFAGCSVSPGARAKRADYSWRWRMPGPDHRLLRRIDIGAWGGEAAQVGGVAEEHSPSRRLTHLSLRTLEPGSTAALSPVWRSAVGPSALRTPCSIQAECGAGVDIGPEFRPGKQVEGVDVVEPTMEKCARSRVGECRMPSRSATAYECARAFRSPARTVSS